MAESMLANLLLRFGGNFGTGSPAEEAETPHPLANLLLGATKAAATLPQRAIQNSQYSLDNGTYDPSVPVETALTLAGGGMPMAERGALGMAGGKLGNPSLFDTVAAKYPQLKIDGAPARSANDYATLGRIAVPEELRGQGLATKAMQDIIAEADRSGTNLALSPSGDWGASVPRLKEFYSRFGFVPNAGRNKDFATRETMIRAAKKSEE